MSNSTYLGNENLKGTGVKVQFSPEQIAEYVKCSQDPVYFIRKYIKIVNLDKGLIPFDMYKFQEDMVRTVHNNRFTIAKLPRQSGKSTTVVSYILHYILFNDSVNVAILAHKQEIARELLGKLKVAYEYIPKWLQHGILEWNKGSVILENGSRVKASATSSSAIRGGSFNAIFLDEFAYVPTNIADDFYSSAYPTISSGTDTKVMIFSTPNGLNMFYKIWTDAEEKKNSFVPIAIHWSDIPGRDQNWRKQQIANTSVDQFRSEYECDFIGSTNTLITATKLKSMPSRTPISRSDQGLSIFEYPNKDSIYVLVADTARGVGGDFHAFVVIDISEIPYKVVATFKNNEISPMIYPNAIFPIAKKYNDAYILVEINDIGGQVADILYHELEYENMLMSSFRGRKGQTLDGGFGASQSQLGVRTTKPIKRIGCSLLKDLIEDDKLIIQDINIIQELVSFVSKSTTFEAESGHHDDLVICLVLFCWLTTQAYFKDLTNMDIRKRVFDEKLRQLEDEIVPFGFINNGLEEDEETDVKGNVWSNENPQNYT